MDMKRKKIRIQNEYRKKKFRRAKRKEQERRKKSINGLGQRKLNKNVRNFN